MTKRMTERYSPEKWYDRAVAKTPDWSPLDEDTSPVDLLSALPEGVKISAAGVVLPDDLSFDQWIAVGRALIAMERYSLWALAEWWAWGRHKYRDKSIIAKKLGYDFGYLCNLGWVARSVPISSRNERLSMAHHMKVAKLSTASQEHWLGKAVEEKWSAATLEKEIREREKVDRSEKDQESEQKDPESYRKEKAQRAGADAVYEFDKLLSANVSHHVQAITMDPVFIADLDVRLLRRMLSKATAVADTFNEVVDALKQEQERRSAEVTDPEKPTMPKKKVKKRERLEERPQ